MITLGIESTAHTFGIGIVDDSGKILANERDLFHTEKGGMIPYEVAEHHEEVCDILLKKALKTANITLKNVDIIAFSQSPGLGHALRIGGAFARSLAIHTGKPLIGVNHCIAHLEIGRMLTKCKDPVMCYVSGANTQMITFEKGKYRIFGETLDTGIGNFLDTFARHLNLGFPGGPKIEKLALQGEKFIELPYIVKGMDLSFSGLLTSLKTKCKENCEETIKKDLCYSAQETAFAMTIEVAERAMAHCNKKELLLAGGVACNSRLVEMAKKMVEARGGKLFCPAKEFLVDNGAMIAWTGYLQSQNEVPLKIIKAEIKPYLRTDEIDISWR